MNEVLLYAIAVTTLLISDTLLLGLGVMLWRRRRPAQVQTDPALTEAQATLAQELQGVGASVAALAERLGRIESALERVRERGEQSQTGVADKEGDRKAFEVATRLALKGAAVDEMVNLCGLTRGEAELIRMLHSGDRPRSALGSQIQEARG